jgi:hypothetical protein
MKRTIAFRRQMARRTRMIGLAVVAVLIVSVVASAAAVAARNPVLVLPNGSAATNLAVTGSDTGISVLQSAATGHPKVECESALSVATVNTTLAGNGKTSGTANVTFKKCKSAAGKCKNTATEGEITGTVSTLLVWVGKETNKSVGVLVSISGESGTLLSFKCAGVLTDVEGAFVALTSKKLNETFTTAKLIGKEQSGVQQDQTYTENGAEAETGLCSSTGGEAFATAGEELEDEESYATSVKVIEA